MKRILCALLLFACSFAQAAPGLWGVTDFVNGGHFTALLGVSKFTPHSDGVWYQEAFPYRLHMISPSWGFRWDTAQFDHFSLSIGYMDLGHVKSVAQAVALDGSQPNDGGYNAGTKSCNGTCWPLSHWYSDGTVRGVFAAATWHHGPWSFEAGPYLYFPKWSMDVPDWIACRTCQRQHIAVTDNAHWQIGPMIGMAYQINDRFSLNLSAWHTASEQSQYSSLYHNATFNASVGYTF